MINNHNMISASLLVVTLASALNAAESTNVGTEHATTAEPVAAATKKIDPISFINSLPALNNGNNDNFGSVPAFDGKGFGDYKFWERQTLMFSGVDSLSPESSFVNNLRSAAMKLPRQANSLDKTSVTRDIFLHVLVVAALLNGITDISLGLFSDASKVGRIIRSIHRPLGWTGQQMVEFMQILGYANDQMITLANGKFDFKDEASQGALVGANLADQADRFVVFSEKAGNDIGKVVGKLLGRRR
ncbi:MAG: hypothetical protein Q8K36_03185 [Alphaproteobacteria bacterium]|nr:hypothetical protein [Alphaproteobacteria bacterium]